MILVRASDLTLRVNDITFPCAIGKNGVSANKREGDNCTPLGVFLLRECWYRADRIAAPKTSLPLRIITPNDGWCDDPAHPLYNRHVRLPFEARHEKLWRDDHAYDVIVPLGYNDDPPVPGLGSAIFLHVARAHSSSEAVAHLNNYQGTEGCVALALPDLLTLLEKVDVNTSMQISA